MFATLTRAAGVFVFTCPFEKRHVFDIFYVFGQYLVNIGQYSYVPTYWTVLRTVRYGVKYYTVPYSHVLDA